MGPVTQGISAQENIAPWTRFYTQYCPPSKTRLEIKKKEKDKGKGHENGVGERNVTKVKLPIWGVRTLKNGRHISSMNDWEEKLWWHLPNNPSTGKPKARWSPWLQGKSRLQTEIPSQEPQQKWHRMWKVWAGDLHSFFRAANSRRKRKRCAILI